jgi:cation diffusion facilitator family transporter
MPLHQTEVTANSPNTEYAELQRLVFWTLWCQVLLIAIIVTVQFIGGSLTLGAKLIDASAGLLLYIFNIISIGIILRQNPFSHPYGTGKLENFAGFLFAILVIPGSLWILYSAYGSYLQPPTTANLGLATLPILLSAVRAAWLYMMARHIVQRYAQPSPMTQSCLVNMRVTTVTDLLLLTGVLIGFGVSLTHYGGTAVYFDMAISILQGLYLLYAGIRVLLANFKSLIDLPLPEDDQFKILQALTVHFEAYEDVGNIFTQLSGSTRFVQIELYVKPDTTAEEIQSLSTDIENRLKEHFGKLLFHLIPLVK